MTNTEHEKVLSESSYSDEYEICTKDGSFTPYIPSAYATGFFGEIPAGYFTGFFRDIVGGWPSEWTFCEKMHGNNPDNEYIFLRKKRSTTKNPERLNLNEWVGIITTTDMERNRIGRRVYRHAEKQFVWDAIMAFMRRGDFGNNPQDYSVSILRIEFYIPFPCDMEIKL